MRVFIVHAHPEPKSFNGAMTREATTALKSAGHEVVVSDLYAMGFNPVSDRRNFTTVADAGVYRQQAEERAAHLARYRERVLGLATAPIIAYPRLDDYDSSFVLKTP